MNEFVVIYNKETGIETYTEINENLEVVPFGKILYYKAYDDKDLPAYVRIGDWYPNVYKKVNMDGKTRLVKAPHLKHHVTNFAGVGGFSFE